MRKFANAGKARSTAFAAAESLSLPSQAVPSPLDRLHRIDEVAHLLGVSRRTIFALIAQRALPTIRISRRGVRVAASDVAAFIASRRSV